MAILALITRADMTGRLAGGPQSIVATDTAAGHDIVIHTRKRGPLGAGVTFLAQRHGLDVVGRHVLARHPAAAGMTDTTL